VTIFVPDSAAAAQYPNLLFFYFTIFLVPFADTISTEPSPERFQCHQESVRLKKVMRPKI